MATAKGNNPKIKPEYAGIEEKPKPGIRLLNIPVSPTRREACASILESATARIDNALNAHRKQVELAAKRKLKAAEPWERLKRKLVTRDAKARAKGQV